VARFAEKTGAVAAMELRKLRRDPRELLTRAVQPALWLLMFGQVFGRAHVIPTGRMTYLQFLVPGILAQSVLFIAIFHGISLIWERDLGIVHKFLASPTPRAALVLGKALAGSARGLSQAVIVLILAALLGVKLRWTPFALGGVIFFVALGSAVFSTFSLIIACLVKTRERFMGVPQVLTMPLFFASNAIYPVEMMPAWLAGLAQFNPLTYEVRGLRALMIPGESLGGVGWDALALGGILVLLVFCGARLYPNLVR
jgi:ABC-2 type transport system permease protein